MMRRMSLVAAALLLVRMAPAAAPGQPSIAQFIPMMCPSLVQQMTGPPQMFMALKDERLNGEAICGCAGEAFMKDAQIAKLAALKPEQLEQQAAGGDLLMSYVAMRAIQSILHCLAVDIDGQLVGVELPMPAPQPTVEPQTPAQ